jgi:hypothetical protein
MTLINIIVKIKIPQPFLKVQITIISSLKIILVKTMRKLLRTLEHR